MPRTKSSPDINLTCTSLDCPERTGGACNADKGITITSQEIQFLHESNAIENERDAQALIEAIEAWEYVREQKVLSPQVIKKAHKILMQSRDFDEAYKGKYRKYAVGIQTWTGFIEKMKWQLIPNAILQWCETMNNLAKLKMDEGDIAFIQSHVQYEEIHPFGDGNGRTGRIFLNWLRVRCGLSALVIYESEKQKYYDWFRH